MSFSNRNLRLFYLIIFVWGFISLALAENFYSTDGIIGLFLAFVVFFSASFLPLIWVWLLERSPWSRWLIWPTLVIPGWFIIISLDTNRMDVAATAFVWCVIFITTAYINNKTTSISSLKWRHTKSIERKFINNNEYLLLLNDISLIGFPSIYRLHEYFLNNIDNIFSYFNYCVDNNINRGSDINNSFINRFFIQKFACELTFLCAISYLDRMCGPDFRYTKQFRLLAEEIIKIGSLPDSEPIADLGAFASHAVVNADLVEIIEILQMQRDSEGIPSQKKNFDDDITVALAALRLTAKRGIISSISDNYNNLIFPRIIKGAMNIMRETFSRNNSEIGVS